MSKVYQVSIQSSPTEPNGEVTVREYLIEAVDIIQVLAKLDIHKIELSEGEDINIHLTDYISGIDKSSDEAVKVYQRELADGCVFVFPMKSIKDVWEAVKNPTTIGVTLFSDNLRLIK